MAKINVKIKQLDAAVRLVAGSRKKSSVIVTPDQLMCSTGQDVCAPVGVPLAHGMYSAEELLAVYAVMKHAGNVQVANEQADDGSWRILLFDPENGDRRAYLTWSGCTPPEIAVPDASWPVTKDQRKMLKTAYALAQTLDKHHLRLVRLQPQHGVLSYLSPTTVAQWWNAEWAGDGGDIEIGVADVKRALAYRGGPLIGVGASHGKINFAFDDGAFLRVDKYDGNSYDDVQLARVFDFDEGSYVWPLGAEQPAQALLEMIANGGKVSETDGQTFYNEYGDATLHTQMPLLMCAGKFYPKVINALAERSTAIQPSGPQAFWENVRLAFYGEGYRAVTSISFDHEGAAKRGIIEREADVSE